MNSKNQQLLEKVLKENIEAFVNKKNISKKDTSFEKNIYSGLDKIIIEEIEELKNDNISLLENVLPDYNKDEKLNQKQIQDILKAKIAPILEEMNLHEFSGDNPVFIDGLTLEVAFTLDLIKKNKFNQIKKLVERTYNFYNKEFKNEDFSKKETIVETHLNNIFDDWQINKKEYSKIISEANEYLKKYGIQNLLWDPYEISILKSINEQSSNFYNEKIKELVNWYETLSKNAGTPKDEVKFKNLSKMVKNLTGMNPEEEPITDLTQSEISELKQKALSDINKIQKGESIFPSGHTDLFITSPETSKNEVQTLPEPEIKTQTSSPKSEIEQPPEESSTTNKSEIEQSPKESKSTTNFENIKNQTWNYYEKVRDSILNFIRGVKGESGGELNSAQAIGKTIRDYLYTKKGAIILGVTLLGLIALYIWKKRKSVCDGLTGSRKIICQKKAIDSVLIGLKSQLKNCPLTSNQEKCQRDIRRVMSEWELRRREL